MDKMIRIGKDVIGDFGKPMVIAEIGLNHDGDVEKAADMIYRAKESGADRVRYCDTVGILDPFETYKRVKAIIDEVGITVEMHTHSDFGMGTANAIAGLKAGATYVNTTVNGLGERAGNASMEELVMALQYSEGVNLGIDGESQRIRL